MELENFFLCTFHSTGILCLSNKREICNFAETRGFVTIACTMPKDIACSMRLVDLMLVLGVPGCIVETDETSSYDDALRALDANMAMLHKLRHAGPYETVFIKNLDPNYCRKIADDAVRNMIEYVPKSDIEVFLLRVDNLPDHCIELPQNEASIEWDRDRRTYGNYVLPKFTPTEPCEYTKECWHLLAGILEDGLSRKKMERFVAKMLPQAPETFIDEALSIMADL